MSHFGRSGPPDIRDTYSLLVLNISFRTSADDLFPLFDRYGKVVDVFIPRDRRTGDSRGFAFVRYKSYQEAEKAVGRLDGRHVDGRNISVQFAKYGRETEIIKKGKIKRENLNWKRSRSRSPRKPRWKDESDYRRRSEFHDEDRYPRGSRHHRSRSWSRSRSGSPVRRRADDGRSRDYDFRNSHQRTPDRKPSPHSSRGSSPREWSLSSAPGGSPRALALPLGKERASPSGLNGDEAGGSRTPCNEGHLRGSSLNLAEEDQ